MTATAVILRWARQGQRLARKPALIGAFLLCALPVGAAFCIAVPPSVVPDEPTHIARAAGLLHGAVLAERKIGPNLLTGAPEWVAGVKQPGWLALASTDITAATGPETQAAYKADRAWTRRDLPGLYFTQAPNTAMYFPATYVPAAIGLEAGILSGASPHACIVWARFGMLAAFLGLGAWAIAAAAFGEAVFIAIMLLPLTLFLAGSVNQDAVIIGMLCVAAALMTRADGAGRGFAMLFLALAFGAKPPYLPLALLLLMPLRAPLLAARLRDLAIVVIPVLIWVALISATVMVPFDDFPAVLFYHPGPLAPAGARGAWFDQLVPAANLQVLLADPARLFTLPWRAAATWNGRTLREAVGLLRWRGLHLGEAYYAAAGLAAAAALLGVLAGRRQGPARFSAADHALAGAAIAGALWAVLLSLYLNSTPFGGTAIQGFNVRYVLPLLPFMVFVVPAAGRGVAPGGVAAWPALALGLFGIVYLPMVVIMTIYLH